MLKKGIWALASVSSLRHALLCVPKPCPSFAGFFTQISTLADVQENVMEYLHVLSRPKVIDQEHDVVWTEAYIDSTVSLQGPGERLGVYPVLQCKGFLVFIPGTRRPIVLHWLWPLVPLSQTVGTIDIVGPSKQSHAGKWPWR